MRRHRRRESLPKLRKSQAIQPKILKFPSISSRFPKKYPVHGMFSYHFIPFLAYSLLVIENDQPTSYSLFRLEQSRSPSLFRRGQGVR